MVEAHKIFTHASVVALIETVAGTLRQVAARWRRDRWYFLGPERCLTAPPLPQGWTWNEAASAFFGVGAEIKRTTGTQAVSPCWRAPGLSAQIRVRWFPDPSRPKNTPVFLLIDFARYMPLTEDELRRREAEVPALLDPPPDVYESRDALEAYCAYEQWWHATYGEKAQALAEMRKDFYTPQQRKTVRDGRGHACMPGLEPLACLQHTMTVQAWLGHAHNPYKAIRKEKGWTLAKWQAYVLEKNRKRAPKG